MGSNETSHNCELSVDESVQFGRAEVVPFDGLWHRWEVRCYTPTGHLWSTSHHRHQVRAAVKADQFVRAGFFRLDPSLNARTMTDQGD